jgi:hypothetical protein
MTFFWARQRVLLFFLLAGIVVPAFSQPKNIITSIRVNGLKLTKPRTAEEPLRRFLGQEADLIDRDNVKAAVIDQGILDPLSVTIEEDTEMQGKTLVVEVKEKWPVFFGPFLFTGSGGLTAGLFFYHANAFGLNDQMVLGGMYKNGGWLAMALYGARPGSAGYFGWFAKSSFSEWEHRNANANDETLRRFNTRSIEAGASLQYKINNIADTAFNISYTNTELLDTESPVNMPDSGMSFFEFGPEISLRKTDWDGYFLLEQTASLKYNIIVDLTADVWHSISFKCVYEKPVLPGFRVNIRCGGIFRPDAPELLETGPDEAGVNILPVSFSARYYTGLSLGLEKYLYRFSFGTISLFGAWQMAYSGGAILGNRFDYGVISSLRFYMSRLAIPAMGAGLAYNIMADYFQFFFSIGMTL